MNSSFLTAGAAVLVLGATGMTRGAIITAISANNSPAVVNTIPAAETNAGYHLYGVTTGTTIASGGSYFNGTSAGKVASLPNWASISLQNAGNTFFSNSHTTLTVAGTAYRTGGNPDPMLLTLSAGVPSELTIGVLADHTNKHWDITVNSTTTHNSSVTIQARTSANYVNNFYYFKVTDISVGDVVRIDGAEMIGGITLVGVPEPSMLAVASVAGLGLISRRRRHA